MVMDVDVDDRLLRQLCSDFNHNDPRSYGSKNLAPSPMVRRLDHGASHGILYREGTH